MHPLEFEPSFNQICLCSFSLKGNLMEESPKVSVAMRVLVWNVHVCWEPPPSHCAAEPPWVRESLSLAAAVQTCLCLQHIYIQMCRRCIKVLAAAAQLIRSAANKGWGLAEEGSSPAGERKAAVCTVNYTCDKLLSAFKDGGRTRVEVQRPFGGRGGEELSF